MHGDDAALPEAQSGNSSIQSTSNSLLRLRVSATDSTKVCAIQQTPAAATEKRRTLIHHSPQPLIHMPLMPSRAACCMRTPQPKAWQHLRRPTENTHQQHHNPPPLRQPQRLAACTTHMPLMPSRATGSRCPCCNTMIPDASRAALRVGFVLMLCSRTPAACRALRMISTSDSRACMVNELSWEFLPDCLVPDHRSPKPLRVEGG